MDSAWEEAKRQVCAAARSMHSRGLAAGSSGNVSARIPNSQQAAITPSGLPYESMEPADIVIIDLKGNILEGKHRPSSETPFHTLIYLLKPAVSAIVHTHSLYATAISCLRQPLPLISNEGFPANTPQIEVTRYALPGTIELGYYAIEALDLHPGARAALLASHGVLAVGSSLAQALSVAENIELEAKIYCIARSAGQPVALGQDTLEEVKKVYPALKS